MADKKHYYVNVIEANDEGKMCEALNFNFGGHHDLAAMVDNAKASGIFAKDKHAKEFVLGMRFLHHVLKKYPDAELFKTFWPQFEEFKKNVKATLGCPNCSK
ncbi:MAG: DUF3861 family protein [Candidatus Amulumruptor caecigallinarius]|nr:DUF3861 family protein [Candidatus Amulumruptor caecigallinarius]MCM1396832.1 DUF3861 family protein [Candidatus Amulumruptor caecigallinarius]MCM1454224.1 DUF3861 family protein [bacterium]